MKTAKPQEDEPTAEEVDVSLFPPQNQSDKEAWEKGKTLASSQNFARTLTETPANRMTPTIFVQRVRRELEGLPNVKVNNHEYSPISSIYITFYIYIFIFQFELYIEMIALICLQVISHGKDWAEEKKMGCLLGVSQGSTEPLQFLEMHYNGGGNTNTNQKPLVLVGKGVTFDSGGISIKPSEGMGLMKGDMGGAGISLI